MNRIKELREEKGLYQQDLAQMLNLKQATVSSWELGKSEPNFATLIELSRLFECKIDYIIGNENDIGNIEYTKSTTTEQDLILAILHNDKQYNTLIKNFAKLSYKKKNEVIDFVKTLI
ncbi:MAG: helix-turn-helix transcriptional regulator [Bacillota bacterium]